MHAESINLHENQGSRNNLMPSHSEANDSPAPQVDTVLEQHYDHVTPLDASNNMHVLKSVLEEGCKNYQGD